MPAAHLEAPMAAPDAIQAAPDVYRVVLENETVRVLEVRLAPGSSSALHAHPHYVIYNLDDGKVEFTSATGETVQLDLKAGEAMWRDAEEHGATNLGSKDLRAVLVELK
jgi:quercetin dioxygenase-like cupin family protein